MLAGISSSSGPAVLEAGQAPEMWIEYLVGGSGVDPAKRGIGDQSGIYTNGWAWFVAQNVPAWIGQGWHGLHLQTPGGVSTPLPADAFEGDQFLMCNESADPNLQALYTGFGAAWSPYTSLYPKSGKLQVRAYIGNFQTAIQTTNWQALGDVAWAARRDASIAPILAAGCSIGLDNAGLVIPDADRNIAWYRTIKPPPTVEPFLTAGMANLAECQEVIAQDYWDGGFGGAAAQVVRHTKRYVLLSPDPPGNAAAQRDFTCKWAFKIAAIHGYVPQVPHHLINVGDTPGTVYSHGAALWAASPEVV